MGKTGKMNAKLTHNSLQPVFNLSKAVTKRQKG